MASVLGQIKNHRGIDVAYLTGDPLGYPQFLRASNCATIVRAMKEVLHPGTKKGSVDLNKASRALSLWAHEWKYVASGDDLALICRSSLCARRTQSGIPHSRQRWPLLR